MNLETRVNEQGKTEVLKATETFKGPISLVVPEAVKRFEVAKAFPADATDMYLRVGYDLEGDKVEVTVCPAERYGRGGACLTNHADIDFLVAEANRLIGHIKNFYCEVQNMGMYANLAVATGKFKPTDEALRKNMKQEDGYLRRDVDDVQRQIKEQAHTIEGQDWSIEGLEEAVKELRERLDALTPKSDSPPDKPAAEPVAEEESQQPQE